MHVIKGLSWPTEWIMSSYPWACASERCFFSNLEFINTTWELLVLIPGLPSPQLLTQGVRVSIRACILHELLGGAQAASRQAVLWATPPRITRVWLKPLTRGLSLNLFPCSPSGQHFNKSCDALQLSFCLALSLRWKNLEAAMTCHSFCIPLHYPRNLSYNRISEMFIECDGLSLFWFPKPFKGSRLPWFSPW